MVDLPHTCLSMAQISGMKKLAVLWEVKAAVTEQASESVHLTFCTSVALMKCFQTCFRIRLWQRCNRVGPEGKLYLFAVSMIQYTLINVFHTQHNSFYLIPLRFPHGSEILPSRVHLFNVFPAGIQPLPLLLHPPFSDKSSWHLLFHTRLLCVCPTGRPIRWPLQCNSVRGQFVWHEMSW